MEYVWRFVKAAWRFFNGLVTAWIIIALSFWVSFWAVESYRHHRLLSLSELGLTANQPKHHRGEIELR